MTENFVKLISEVIHMKLLRMFTTLFLAFSVGVVCAENENNKRVIIAVGGKATMYYLPLTIAEQKGFFKDEGLDVKILDFPGGSKALQALIGRSADIVSGGFDHTIMMQTRGQRIKAFLVQGKTPAISLVIAKKKIDTWEGVSSLKGWKIGVTSPGSSTNMFVNALLSKAGLSVEDVSIIGVGTGQSAIAAIMAGHIDALANVEPAISILLRGSHAREVVETISEAGSEMVYGASIPSASLYTKESYIDKNPDIILAVTKAMKKSLAWLQIATNEEVMEVLPRAYLMNDAALYSSALTRQRPNFSESGRFEVDSVEKTLESLAKFNKIDLDNIDLKSTFTNDFVDKSLR